MTRVAYAIMSADRVMMNWHYLNGSRKRYRAGSPEPWSHAGEAARQPRTQVQINGRRAHRSSQQTRGDHGGGLDYLGAIDALVVRRDTLEGHIARLVPDSP